MINYEKLRQNMILGQLMPSHITCTPLIDAMSLIPREKFIPALQAFLSYSDQTIEISENRYLLAPVIFATLVQEAKISSPHHVLDIGFGNGYSSLILASLAHKVTALENHKDFVANLKQLKGDYQLKNLKSVCGSLEKGWPQGAPYDMIMIQGASDHVPAALMNQLKNGGCLVMMMKKPDHHLCQATLVFKQDNSWTYHYLFEGHVPILKEFQSKARFIL